jgi:hypothetical protein
VEAFVSPLSSVQVVTTLHPSRNNVYDEIKYNLKWNKLPYLKTRYRVSEFDALRDFMVRHHVPSGVPLFSAGMFSRVNTQKMNDVFDEWWDLIIQHTVYDQCFLSYVLWKHAIEWSSLPYENPYFYVGAHWKLQ